MIPVNHEEWSECGIQSYSCPKKLIRLLFVRQSKNSKFQGIVKVVPSEEVMVESIKNLEIDLYFDSPIMGMKIAETSEISLVLLSWKEGHRDYHSVFIAPIDSDITFDELYGQTIVFEDKESTSGYYLPLIHLEKAGYKIKGENKDFTPVFSLDDENTPIWILEGKGDIGATSNLDFEDMPINIKEKVKVIESTESVPRQMIFVKNDYEFQNTIKTILLEMNDSEETVKILKKISKTTQFSEIDVDKDIERIKELMEIIQ